MGSVVIEIPLVDGLEMLFVIDDWCGAESLLSPS
jgi:hypothetical protein